jgi:hypothetical protein
MKTQAIKKDGHYYIPYLEKLGLDADEVTIEIDENIIKQIMLKKDNMKQDLENLNKEMGGNKLAESVLDGMPDSVECFKTENQKECTDEYVKEHWRDFIMNSGYSEYYKSELYREERGKYLMEKYQ